MIYNGLYLSAVSVSQDITLRKSIRKSVIEQSKLLHSIGTAEMERQVQKQVMSVATKTSNAMANETGIQASMNEDENERLCRTCDKRASIKEAIKIIL